MNYDEVIIDTDAALVPLQAASQQFTLIPPAQLVAGQLRSIAGQFGPDLTVATAAALNGVAVSFAAAANLLTFGLTGLGTMGQRNAAAAVADLNQTIGAVPTQAEVQAISDKVDELLASLRAAGHLTP